MPDLDAELDEVIHEANRSDPHEVQQIVDGLERGIGYIPPEIIRHVRATTRGEAVMPKKKTALDHAQAALAELDDHRNGIQKTSARKALNEAIKCLQRCEKAEGQRAADAEASEKRAKAEEERAKRDAERNAPRPPVEKPPKSEELEPTDSEG